MLLTQNKNPNAFLSRFWAVTHEDTLRVMWPQISQYLGFVGVCGRWRWALDGGSTWTQRGVLGQNPLFASFAHTHGHCHQKKAFWGKKKKNLHRCRKHLCVNFSSSPATSSPASAARVIPPAFPTPFPSRCQNQGGGWERGGSAGVPTTMKSSFGGGWQGGLILFIRAQALYSHGFLTRHPVNSRIPQTEEALAYLYCVLALAP